MSDILNDMAQNAYLREENRNFINEVAKRAVMFVEALGMNTAQPSDLANQLQHPEADLNPSVTISTAEQCYPGEHKQIVNDSCDLGEGISSLSNPYAGRRPKQNVPTPPSVGNNAPSRQMMDQSRKMSAKIEVSCNAEMNARDSRVQKQTFAKFNRVRVRNLNRQRRHVAHLLETIIPCVPDSRNISVHAHCTTRNPPSNANAFKGARRRTQGPRARPMITNQSSKIIELAGETKVGVEKELDEQIRWKNMCPEEEEIHVESEKQFGEVEKAQKKVTIATQTKETELKV
ncbi:hypothetical protein BT96DRAFT_1007562 [Gymnopus androsaceus JB14]|uniref:Uncharacterized protein n=1 Tax=Gymnopus androsaceus JB14 TaxID=1447944 RepID=A0A6A4GH78_9AGAR|nr:hypothetical protein BT96DRAFT_1007562 [Gymnopus androsaceus JB14]